MAAPSMGRAAQVEGSRWVRRETVGWLCEDGTNGRVLSSSPEGGRAGGRSPNRWRQASPRGGSRPRSGCYGPFRARSAGSPAEPRRARPPPSAGNRYLLALAQQGSSVEAPEGGYYFRPPASRCRSRRNTPEEHLRVTTLLYVPCWLSACEIRDQSRGGPRRPLVGVVRRHGGHTATGRRDARGRSGHRSSRSARVACQGPRPRTATHRGAPCRPRTSSVLAVVMDHVVRHPPTDRPGADTGLSRAWREHRRHVLDIGLRMLGDRGDAEDVVRRPAFARAMSNSPAAVALSLTSTTGRRGDGGGAQAGTEMRSTTSPDDRHRRIVTSAFLSRFAALDRPNGSCSSSVCSCCWQEHPSSPGAWV